MAISTLPMSAWADVTLTDERMKRIKLLYVQKCMQSDAELTDILLKAGTAPAALNMIANAEPCSSSVLFYRISDPEYVGEVEASLQKFGPTDYANGQRQFLRETYAKYGIAGLIGRLEGGEPLGEDEIKLLFAYGRTKAKSDAMAQTLDQISD